MRFPRTVLATCCLPWTDELRLDEDLFADHVRRLVSAGLDDLYLFGTAGEGYAVTDRQFIEVVDLFVDVLRSVGGTPMVGVISTSVPTVLERIEAAMERGVRRFQISLPNWGVVNDVELRVFFDVVLGAFPDSEFLHYNLSRTGRLVTADEYAEIAERHPNLVATKYGAGNAEVIASLMSRAPMLRHFFTELGFWTGSALGECGLLASISTINPVACRQYFNAVLDQPQLAAEMYAELAGVMTALRQTVGPGPHIDAAFDKLLVRVTDERFPLRLLPPYQSSDQTAVECFLGVLREKFPRWLPGH